MKYILIGIVVWIVYITMNKIYQTHNLYGNIMRQSDELRKGLMYRKHKLHDDEGMLFVMKPQSTTNSVWMKHTYLSLDVIFLDNTMKIVDYVENTTPLSTESITSNKSSSYILEMNQNSVKKHNLQRGDFINFTEI